MTWLHTATRRSRSKLVVAVLCASSLACTEAQRTREPDADVSPALEDAGALAFDALTVEPDADGVDFGDASVETGDAAVGAPGDAPLHTPLVHMQSFRRVSLEEDPFDDAPDALLCERAGTIAEKFAEEDSFAVETGKCNYVTVVQPSLAEVRAGDMLYVRLWHFDLTFPTDAEAHVAVLIDGLPLLDARVPIPAKSGLLRAALPAERAIPPGAPIHFHLHNHGANSWSLLEIGREAY